MKVRLSLQQIVAPSRGRGLKRLGLGMAIERELSPLHGGVD